MATVLTVPLHWSMGQSNGIGSMSGRPVAQPSFPPMTQFCGRKTELGFSDITQKLVGAGAGSPMFHLLDRWHELTGERAIALMSNEGATGLLKAAKGKGSWQVGIEGSLYEQAFLHLKNLTRTVSLSPRVAISRVYVHWCQGEQDATTHDGKAVTGPLYQVALQEIHDRTIADIASLGLTFGKFCVYQTGCRADDLLNPRWEAIREAQTAFVAANPDTSLMVWDKAKEDGALVVDDDGNWISGWALVDEVHYTEASWRAMGRGGATNLFAAL